MAATPGSKVPRARSPRSGATGGAKWSVAPVLVKQVRGEVTEAVHRGDVVEVDATGRMLRLIGDPDRVVNLRSAVKPFGLLALLRAGGRKAFDLTSEEIALMASSHSGEDVHVRTIQALYRRLNIPTAVIQTGTDGSPLDELTAARLARDGERPSTLRHMCSGQHTVFILLSKLRDWPLDTYWHDDHPAAIAYADAVAAVFGVKRDRLVTGIDGCGILTYAFPLRAVATAYAVLADPQALAPTDPRAALAGHLTEVRDAMRAHPELVGGNRDRLDTSLMKALDGGVVSKSGMEALRGIGILPGARANGAAAPASGMAVKIEDGDGYERASWAASVEALRQAGVIEGQALRALARYHRPVVMDPHGRPAAEAVPEFELAPVGELIA